jgi:hypothetical protein
MRKFIILLFFSLFLFSCSAPILQTDWTLKIYEDFEKPSITHWKLIIDWQDYFVDWLDWQANIDTLKVNGQSCLSFNKLLKCWYSTFELIFIESKK